MCGNAHALIIWMHQQIVEKSNHLSVINAA